MMKSKKFFVILHFIIIKRYGKKENKQGFRENSKNAA